MEQATICNGLFLIDKQQIPSDVTTRERFLVRMSEKQIDTVKCCTSTAILTVYKAPYVGSEKPDGCAGNVSHLERQSCLCLWTPFLDDEDERFAVGIATISSCPNGGTVFSNRVSQTVYVWLDKSNIKKLFNLRIALEESAIPVNGELKWIIHPAENENII